MKSFRMDYKDLSIYLVNIMVAYNPVTQETRASATTELISHVN